MNKIIINFSNCKSPMDLHKEIKEKLKLPEWYGNNLSALWDMLTGFIETPIDITIVNNPENQYTNNLKESVLKIIDIFKEAAKEDNEITLICDLK